MSKKTKREKEEAKHLARLRRLAARLTVLNSEEPTSAYKRHMWTQERANLIRQLAKYNIRMEP